MRSEEEGRLGEAGGEQECLSTPTPASCPGLNRQGWVHHSLAQNPLSLSGAKPLPGFGDSLLCCSPSSATHRSHPAPAAISDQRFSTRCFPSRVSNKEVVLPHLVRGAWPWHGSVVLISLSHFPLLFHVIPEKSKPQASFRGPLVHEPTASLS